MNFYNIIENIKTSLREDDRFSETLIDDAYRNENMPYPMSKTIITVGLQDVEITPYSRVDENDVEVSGKTIAMTVGFDIFVPKTASPNLASVMLADLLDIIFGDYQVCTFVKLNCQRTVYDSVCGAYCLSISATTKQAEFS